VLLLGKCCYGGYYLRLVPNRPQVRIFF